MPKIVTMAAVMAGAKEAVLASWAVTTGDYVEAGQVLAEVETEKAMVDLESEVAGKVSLLAVDAGSTVTVGHPIAVIETKGDSDSEIDAAIAEVRSGGQPASNGHTQLEVSAARGEEDSFGTAVGQRTFATPLARRIAKERSVSLGDMLGTGPNGRITREDVELASEPRRTDAAHPGAENIAAPPLASTDDYAIVEPATVELGSQAFVALPVSNMRRAIARRLSAAKSEIPHFYLQGSAEMSALLQIREQINKCEGVRVSINDLLVLIAGRSLARIPEMNRTWDEESGSVFQYEHADIAIAVSNDKGLFTPVVRNVDTSRASCVSEQTADLISRAASGKLKQVELEGGTMALSNLGMFGVENFSAIINPPHASIVALGAILDTPAVSDGRIVIEKRMAFTVSADHRVVDGAAAANWMRTFKELIESPFEALI